MRTQLRSKFLFSLICGLTLVSCQRAQDENSQVEFALPKSAVVMRKTGLTNSPSNKISTLTVSSNPTHVVINISASTLSGGTRFCSYNAKNGAIVGPCDFSSFPTVKVTIPNGNARLIQVMLAYEDDSSDYMTLAYGDVTKDINGDSSLGITVSDLETPVLRSQIKGRYLTSANGGPTGTVEVKLKAKADKPSMILTRTEMFSGWFQAFIVSGLQFEYTVGGVMMWDGAKDVDDLLLEDDYLDVNTRGEVLGWFSPDSVSYLSGKDIPSLPGANCTAASRFQTCLDDNSYFIGPFAPVDAGKFIDVTGSTMSWSYLPGVASEIEGVRIYYRDTIPDESVLKSMMPEHGLLNCEALAALPGTALWSAGVSSSATSFTIPTTPAASPFLALCPYKGTTKYLSVATSPGLDGGSSGPYLRVEISGATGSMGDQITTGNCYPVQVSAYESAGNNYATGYLNSTGSAWSISVEGGGWATFYSDSGCTTGGGTSQIFTIADGDSSSPVSTVYVKSGSSYSGLQFIISSPPSGLIYESSYNSFTSQ